MNERMYELINQCFIGTTDGKMSELNTVANVEKFAELIVRECAGIANKQFEAATGLDDRDCLTAAEMKKHFGVE